MRVILLQVLFLYVITSADDAEVGGSCEPSDERHRHVLSYEPKVKRIMDEIVNNYGEEMYEQYNELINRGARPAGSEHEEIAIDHMIKIARDAGVNDITTEEVDIHHYVLETESLQMILPKEKQMKILRLMPYVNTPPGGIKAHGIVVTDFEMLDKLDPSKVKGKIVIFNHYCTSHDETLLYRFHGASKAAMKGAVATLIRSIADLSLESPYTGAQGFYDNVPKIPTACITKEDALFLWGAQEKRKLIILNLTLSTSSSPLKTRNVLIDIKGYEHPEKQVIVSGHTDTSSMDVRTGATDDGGGVFISWFVPFMLHKLKLIPRRTLRAILWGGEEQGFLGAKEYYKRHEENLDKINFIMEADEGTAAKPLGLEISGTNETICVIKDILSIFASNIIKYNPAAGSDITVFTSKGIPGASLLNQNEKYFLARRTGRNTLEAQNKTDLIEAAAFWTAISYVIADFYIDIPR